MNKIMKEETKTYTIKKGDDDFKVWTRATKFLSDYMTKKRAYRFFIGKTKRNIKVTIIIQEIKKLKRSKK